MGDLTPEEIHRAAIAWCGQKERETFPEDVAYFKYHWWSAPGLRKFAEEHAATGRAALREREGE